MPTFSSRVRVWNNYYSFSVTPDADIALSFDEFSVDIYKQGGADFRYALLSSVDGFADGKEIDAIMLHNTTTFVTFNYDVTSLSNVTDTVEFRIYIIPNSYTNGNNFFRVDNVLLTGTASAIPEPSTLVLIAMATSGLVFFRGRRFRRRL